MPRELVRDRRRGGALRARCPRRCALVPAAVRRAGREGPCVVRAVRARPGGPVVVALRFVRHLRRRLFAPEREGVHGRDQHAVLVVPSDRVGVREHAVRGRLLVGQTIIGLTNADGRVEDIEAGSTDPGRGNTVSKYLLKVSYSVQGTQGLKKEGGTGRKDLVE